MTRGRAYASGALSVAVTTCLVGLACQATAPSASPDIELAVSLPLTGEFRGVGVPLSDAVRVAAAQINSIGGILMRPVTFPVVDDSSNVNQAVSVATGFLKAKPAGYLGPLGSSQVLAVQKLTFAAQVTEITAWATSPALIDASPQAPSNRYLFMTVPPDTKQAIVFARLMYSGIPRDQGDGGAGGGCRRASFVNSDDAYGTALKALTKQSFTGPARPDTSVLTEDVIPTALQGDYASIAAKIVTARPDCLAIIAHAETGAQLERDVKAAIKTDSGHDWSRFFIAGSDALYEPNFIVHGQSDPSDPTSLNATVDTIGPAANTAPGTPEYLAFVNLYKTQFPGVLAPPPFSANQYDAVILLALAIEQAGTASDGQKIRDALFAVSQGGQAFGPAELADAVHAIRQHIDIDYAGASGTLDFAPDGTVVADYVVWTVQKLPSGTYGFANIATVKAETIQ